MNKNVVEEVLTQFLDKAQAMRPYLTQEKNVQFVSDSLNSYEPHAEHLRRQKRYKELIEEKLGGIFNQEELSRIKLFTQNPGVIGNTVDHLGFVNHPTMVSGYMTMGFSKIFGDKKDHDDLLVLSTSAIPLNDYFHKRGFEFNGKHINITSKNDRNALLYLYPKQEISILDKIKQAKELKNYSKEEIEFLEKVDKIISGIDFSTCEKYADQLTKINFYLWPLMLPRQVRDSAPNLITVEVEHVELNYLKELLKNKESFIYDFLFDSDKRKLIAEIFEGATGAWSTENGSGTEYFWHISNGYLEKMRLIDGNLVNEANGFSIPLTPEAVYDALENKTIFPAMLLTYGISVFYCGIKSLAGMGSVQYVTDLKNRWIKYFEAIQSPEVELIKLIDTQAYTNSSMNFSKINETLKEDYAFDLMFQGGKDISYYEKINELPYKYLQYPIVAEFYWYYVKEEDRIAFDRSDFLNQFNWIN